MAVGWYDGPLSGVFRLDHPEEEFAFQSIAERFNPDGLDLRLAKAWPVPLGTVARLHGSHGAPNVTGPHRAVHTHTLPPIPEVEEATECVMLFIAYPSYVERLLAAWTATAPTDLSEAEATRLLETVPFAE